MKRILLLYMLCTMLSISAVAIGTSAKSAILYDAETGRILYEKNAHEQRAIASTTKIMTGLLTVEKSNFDDVVKISREQVGIEGTSLYLKEGEELSVKTLIYGLMLRSGNDAAEALACHVGGDVKNFVEIMNERAGELSMQNTHFENPHGLPADGHFSTAYDMALLAAEAMKNEKFRDIVSTKNYAAEGRSFTNHNKLLGMSDEIDGVKTGFTKAAGRCLVSSAEREGLRLVTVTLNAPDDWDDHIALYNFGFDNFSKHIFHNENETVANVAIAGYGRKIKALATDKIQIVANKDEQIECEIHVPRFCYAPIAKGEVIGKACVLKNGEVVKEIPLCAGEDVKEEGKTGFIQWLKRHFFF